MTEEPFVGDCDHTKYGWGNNNKPPINTTVENPDNFDDLTLKEAAKLAKELENE